MQLRLFCLLLSPDWWGDDKSLLNKNQTCWSVVVQVQLRPVGGAARLRPPGAQRGRGPPGSAGDAARRAMVGA